MQGPRTARSTWDPCETQSRYHCNIQTTIQKLMASISNRLLSQAVLLDLHAKSFYVSFAQQVFQNHPEFILKLGDWVRWHERTHLGAGVTVGEWNEYER